jgi:hypothetical protein
MKSRSRVAWLLCLGPALCQASRLVLADSLPADEPVRNSVPVKSAGDALIVGGSKTELSSGGGGASGEIDLSHVANENLKFVAGVATGQASTAAADYLSLGDFSRATFGATPSVPLGRKPR